MHVCMYVCIYLGGSGRTGMVIAGMVKNIGVHGRLYKYTKHAVHTYIYTYIHTHIHTYWDAYGGEYNHTQMACIHAMGLFVAIKKIFEAYFLDVQY